MFFFKKYRKYFIMIIGSISVCTQAIAGEEKLLAQSSPSEESLRSQSCDICIKMLVQPSLNDEGKKACDVCLQMSGMNRESKYVSEPVEKIEKIFRLRLQQNIKEREEATVTGSNEKLVQSLSRIIESLKYLKKIYTDFSRQGSEKMIVKLNENIRKYEYELQEMSK